MTNKINVTKRYDDQTQQKKKGKIVQNPLRMNPKIKQQKNEGKKNEDEKLQNNSS